MPASTRLLAGVEVQEVYAKAGLEPPAVGGDDLRDVLMKIAGGWPQSRLDELLPHRWRELHAQAARAADCATPPSVSAAA